MQYRRARTKGGTYFFTVNLLNRRDSLLVDNINLLRSVMKAVQIKHAFNIDAAVILPEHLHVIWTLPAGDADYSTRWALIKSAFSRQIHKSEPIRESRIKKRERGIWQRRYWEHLIRDEVDYARHVDYIHYNPVKHGLVDSPTDWPYSSIHQYIRQGVLPHNWGENVAVEDFKVGEAC